MIHFVTIDYCPFQRGTIIMNKYIRHALTFITNRHNDFAYQSNIYRQLKLSVFVLDRGFIIIRTIYAVK